VATVLALAHAVREEAPMLAALPMLTDVRYEARAKYKEYRAALTTDHTPEVRALALGYRALSQGHKVLDMRTALQTTGIGSDGLPRLALVRADASRVFVLYTSNGSVTYSTDPHIRWRGRVARNNHDRFTTILAPHSGNSPREGWARVPVVPPTMRPRHALANYRTLFEAKWMALPTPADPFLLRPIGCGLYILVAAWDVTPLEAAVLGSR
jgi:hypothetical protein